MNRYRSHSLALTGAIRLAGGKGHGGLRIIVLVLLIAAIVVAVTLVRQHRRANPISPSAVRRRSWLPRRRAEPTVLQAKRTDPAVLQSKVGERHTSEIATGVAPVRKRSAANGKSTIEARNLTKHYGEKLALDDLSFDVKPGHVTGFLGPNGAGKSTTMRLIMGLDAPNAGSVTINGRHFHDLAWPLREVGALLEAKAIHPGRSAYSHLRMLAQTNHIPKWRVDEVLDLVGLTSVAQQLAGNFSLGMGQRLGIAEALLGDPGVLLFDEPVNGLDTDGIRWVRGLLKRLASEGRTVFVSSHLMSEMALTADQVVVIGKGRLIAEMPIEEFTSRNSERSVRVRSPQLHRLRPVLEKAGAAVSVEDGAFSVRGLDPERIGELSLRESIVLSELTPLTASLEDAFIESTEGDVEYRGPRAATSAEEARA